jgi:stage V sporulation protein R
MEYEKLSKRDAYGLGRIYEMVINNDPCYAYLQESNSVTDQKLVMAHVYGHADFFKHNFWFSKTNRKMMDEMANHATRVRRHAERHGVEAVERFLDACLAIEHLIDPHSMFMQRSDGRPPWGGGGMAEEVLEEKFTPEKLPAGLSRPVHQSRGRWSRQREEYEEEEVAQGAGARPPTRDAAVPDGTRLDEWQQDTCRSCDEITLRAQAMTKVMNGGGDVLAQADDAASSRPLRSSTTRSSTGRGGAAGQLQPIRSASNGDIERGGTQPARRERLEAVGSARRLMTSR